MNGKNKMNLYVIKVRSGRGYMKYPVVATERFIGLLRPTAVYKFVKIGGMANEQR